MVSVGQRWRNSDFHEFVVEAVKTIDGDIWVHYARADKFGSAGDQKYNCLIGAFEQRFFLSPA